MSAVAYRSTTEGESDWRREARVRQTRACLDRRTADDALVDQADARHRAAIARAGLRHRPAGDASMWRPGQGLGARIKARLAFLRIKVRDYAY